MITKDSEYTMLKQEIISLVEIQNAYIIAMYTITITILGVAFERKSQILFLLPYIILFSFQRIISAKRDGMLRIASYIAVYLEEGTGWESIYETISNRTIESINRKKVHSRIFNVLMGRLCSAQLGLLCSSASIIMHFYNNKIKLLDFYNVKIHEVLIPLIAILLFVSLCYCTKDVFNSKRQQYINNLQEKI